MNLKHYIFTGTFAVLFLILLASSANAYCSNGVCTSNNGVYGGYYGGNFVAPCNIGITNIGVTGQNTIPASVLVQTTYTGNVRKVTAIVTDSETGQIVGTCTKGCRFGICNCIIPIPYAGTFDVAVTAFGRGNCQVSAISEDAITIDDNVGYGNSFNRHLTYNYINRLNNGNFVYNNVLYNGNGVPLKYYKGAHNYGNMRPLYNYFKHLGNVNANSNCTSSTCTIN
jgi:hypothetical protein